MTTIKIIKDSRKKDMWIELETNRYQIFAKVFDEGSEYGIRNGRISKLQIIDSNSSFSDPLYNYDRGLDVDVMDEADLNKIINYLENLNKVSGE